MWSVRRLPNPLLRRQRYNSGPSLILNEKFHKGINVEDKGAHFLKPTQLLSDGSVPSKEFYYRTFVCKTSYMGSRSFCSQATEVNDSLEEGNLDIDTEMVDEDLVSGLELSDNGGKSELKTDKLEFLGAIIADKGRGVNSTLDKWIEEGNTLDRPDIDVAIINLRKRRMYAKALQFMEWLEANKRLEFTERDYSARADLIAKVHGLDNAEKYIEALPESFKTEVVYRSLLANCVVLVNMKRAEQVFDKMRSLNLPVTVFGCNQMILVYKRLDKKKIADILQLMLKESIKASLFTYTLLIDIKGESNDIIGMETLVAVMKAEGIEPDIQTLSILARHYVSGGHKSKAEDVLKIIEEERLKGNRWAQRALLTLYGSLGNADGVRRIWENCELNPKTDEFCAAVEAWGKLGEIDEAEKVFDKAVKIWNRPSLRLYQALLNVYTSNKLVAKGKEFLNQMGNDGGRKVNSATWHAIVRLYIEAGELGEAYSVVEKSTGWDRVKPLFNSFLLIMEQYAKNGDINNTEKVFLKMKQCGYKGRLKPYEVLWQAYVNAKSPAYGFRERMKGDDVFPNKLFATRLAQADPFRRTALSNLLD